MKSQEKPLDLRKHGGLVSPSKEGFLAEGEVPSHRQQVWGEKLPAQETAPTPTLTPDDMTPVFFLPQPLLLGPHSPGALSFMKDDAGKGPSAPH